MQPIFRNREGAAATPESRHFYSVAEVARMCGVSPMTIYREIQAGCFPAIKLRGRWIVPAKAIDGMTEAAVAGQTTVDPADWMPGGVA